jgi:hypothetical protein
LLSPLVVGEGEMQIPSPLGLGAGETCATYTFQAALRKR